MPAVHRPSPHRASELTKDVELLLCCARTHPGSTVIEHVKTLLAGPVDWKRLVQMAHRNRVIPLLHLNVDRLEWRAVPEEIRAELHSDQQSNAATCLRLAGELVRLVALLEQAGIPAIPFKGVALAARAYGDLALRDAGDIDLLVHRRDVVRAVGLLESTGLQPAFPSRP